MHTKENSQAGILRSSFGPKQLTEIIVLNLPPICYGHTAPFKNEALLFSLSLLARDVRQGCTPILPAGMTIPKDLEIFLPPPLKPISVRSPLLPGGRGCSSPHHFKERNFSYRPLKCTHIVTKINSAKQRPEAVSKPCSAWATRAAGRESSRNLIVSPGESICISSEEGNKTGGHPSSFCPGENSTGLFYRSQQSPAHTKCWQLWGSGSSWSAVFHSLGMGGTDLAGRFGNSSQEGTDTTYSN